MKAFKWKNLVNGSAQLVLFVFLAFFTMVMVSYLYVSRIVNTQTRMLGEEMLSTTEEAIGAILGEAEMNFSHISTTVDSMISSGKDKESILPFLASMGVHFNKESSYQPGFLKAYAYLEGEFLDGSGWIPPEDYAPKERPWYIGARETQGVFFSEPYLDADTGEICLSFSKGIRDEQGNEYGVLAMDISLSAITDYMKQLRLDNNGYGVLLSDSIVFVSHREESLIGQKMEEAGEGYLHLAEMLREGEEISAIRFKDWDGKDSIAILRPIFNGWYIGIINSRYNYYKQLYEMGAILAALGLVLMLALSYVLLRTRYEKQKADEENRSKSDFLSRMSHEMRTPMNAIIGMTEIARNTREEEKIQYCLDKIGDASVHLLGVINDVLDMSKIEAGKLELNEDIFELRGILQQVVGVMQFKFKEKNQNFKCTIEETLPSVIRVDGQRLSQLITNLLSNATKFTPEGGDISLEVRSLGRKEEHIILQVQVQDSGIGISVEQQEKLFQAFEQADGSISRKYGGSGLGLSISKRLLELMRGEITVESEEGKGAIFRFTVPVKVEEQGDAAGEPGVFGREEAEGTSSRFEGKRILVAEDVDINREVLLAQLEDSGLLIDCVENGKEACRAIQDSQGKYDLVFMDIQMPEMNGYEATGRIREMDIKGAADIPIIAMTANVFREDVERCLEAGMNGHIGKPLDKKALYKCLRKYLN